MKDLIMANTELILSNIKLIQKYQDKIKTIEFSEYKQYFTKELDWCRHQLVVLEEENKKLQEKIEKVKAGV